MKSCVKSSAAAAVLALLLCGCTAPASAADSPAAAPSALCASSGQTESVRTLTLDEAAGVIQGPDGYQQAAHMLAGVRCRFNADGRLEKIEEVIPPLLYFPDLPDCTISQGDANIEVYPDRARVSRTAQLTYTVPDSPPQRGRRHPDSYTNRRRVYHLHRSKDLCAGNQCGRPGAKRRGGLTAPSKTRTIKMRAARRGCPLFC